MTNSSVCFLHRKIIDVLLIGLYIFTEPIENAGLSDRIDVQFSSCAEIKQILASVFAFGCVQPASKQTAIKLI